MVFLSNERYRSIHREVGMGMEPDWMIGSMIAGNPAVAEKVDLMQKWLEAKHDANPSAFIDDWVKFHLKGPEASGNVWDLLHDWCSLTGYSFLADTRSEIDQLVAGWSSGSFDFPMGRSFALKHRVFEPQSWWQLFSRPSYRTVTVHIDSAEVTSLIGSLEKFAVVGTSFALICDRDMEIRFWGNTPAERI
ncbi:MAG: hypothetical protein C0516_15750 [Gemmatimonas sp.]|nr:hypothetical protein [Gemmatimonas sp.]